jgi:hypothetical protein
MAGCGPKITAAIYSVSYRLVTDTVRGLPSGGMKIVFLTYIPHLTNRFDSLLTTRYGLASLPVEHNGAIRISL